MQRDANHNTRGQVFSFSLNRTGPGASSNRLLLPPCMGILPAAHQTAEPILPIVLNCSDLGRDNHRVATKQRHVRI